MKAKMLARVLVAGVAIPTLAFGVPSVAMADSFFHGDSQIAGPKGAASQSVTAVALSGNGGFGHGGFGHGGFGHGGHGFTLFKQSSSFAGPHGAGSHNILSAAR